MDSKEQASIREISRMLLGSKYRLEVSAQIAAGSGLAYVREVAREIEGPENLVLSEIRRLEKAGLLRRLDRVTGQQQQYYQRVDHPWWEISRALLADLTSQYAK